MKLDQITNKDIEVMKSAKMSKKSVSQTTLIALWMSIALEYYGIWIHSDIVMYVGIILAITNMGVLGGD